MVKKRLIFILFYHNGWFYLSRNFVLQKVGEIDWLINKFNFKNIGDKLNDHLKIKYLKNNQISIKYDKTINNIEDIIFKVKEKGLEIEDIMTEDADLEDVFIKLTKNL